MQIESKSMISQRQRWAECRLENFASEHPDEEEPSGCSRTSQR